MRLQPASVAESTRVSAVRLHSAQPRRMHGRRVGAGNDDLVTQSFQITGSSMIHTGCILLENVAPLWPSLPRGEFKYWVRTFVWAATWNPDTRRVEIVLDEIGLENAIAEDPRLLVPSPPKVLRRLETNRRGRLA